jgi:hypothetical protein
MGYNFASDDKGILKAVVFLASVKEQESSTS